MNVCTDAGFLIGLYDVGDQHHAEATQYFAKLFETSSHSLVVPWPILYEAVSTRTARRPQALASLERHWKYLLLRQQLVILSDLPFRDGVIEECFEELGEAHPRTLSAVDRVLRRMLSSPQLHIDAFITFNTRDFVDIC